MKKYSISVFTVIFSILLGIAYAQKEDTYAAARKAALKDLDKRVDRDYRKQAKALAKEGYQPVIGTPPMEKQLEEAAVRAYMKDERGNAKYYTASQEAKAETFAAAKQQAIQLCLNDIAAFMGSNIVGRIKSDVANSEVVKDATSVTEVIGAYQNTIAAKLARVEPIVQLQKVDKKTGLTYFKAMMCYDMEAAERQIKNDLRKELKQKTSMLQEEIDQLIGL
ncbi:MAG: hypothetical protein NZM38_04955 [Cytophagales bacterium]|nr:hypothetical protein [Cytophagales bacterium]MDW8384101.1 hypothetical protein [Flammeovirgaceae bacterium]